MSPTIEQMRDFVYQMYSGDRWKRRVKRMRDDEIMAIYLKQQEKAAAAELAKRKKDQEEPPPF